MFCLPHSIAFCTSGSPGSESRVMLRQLLAGGDLRGELPRRGCCSALASSCCADGRGPWSEPATASQTVFEPPAGRDSE